MKNMKLITMLDKLEPEPSTAIVVFDMNLSQPLYAGFLGNLMFRLLDREVDVIKFETGKVTYKEEELYYEMKIVLKS